MHSDRTNPRETTAPAERVVLPAGTPAWVTVDLVLLTLKVWQRHYRQALSVEDAVTIVLNAGRLFSVFGRE